jgi:spermidine synthase
VSHVFLERRAGRVRLYLHGDLQFDEADERLYHEPLALVPAALAVARAPGRRLRGLVLGGGDGLALRELLRVPAMGEVHLVDRDPEVLRLAAGPLAALNRGALADPRARVHVRDAREHLAAARGFDVLVYDLTYPGDLAGAALFTVERFAQARAALRPGGVLSVNAVSPELTPQAFGCVGATLEAAGLAATPFVLALPSFAAEGYGRWGFFFAAPRRIGREELRRLRFPAGTALTPGAVLAATRLPAGARAAMRAAPSRTDELLYYVHNATPLAWEGPFRRLRFGRAPRRGPRLTAAHGFARWLREPEGRRTVEELVACLPLAQRGQTREAFLEWSEQAEVLVRAVDLRAFVERALARARDLPRGWVRELRALRDRLRDGLPPMGELLRVAYRVFAVYLLVLLLVNLFFPDNLYAKGWSSSGSGRSWSSSSGPSAPFHGFAFTDPSPPVLPYRHRPAVGPGVSPYRPGVPRSRVYDPHGREHAAVSLTFTDPGGERKPVSALLALTPDLQLLESGALAYKVLVPGYHGLLEPGRLRVLDTAGREVHALLPPTALETEAREQILAQTPLIERALEDHRRWLDWVRWGVVFPQGGGAASQLAELEAIARAVDAAQRMWRAAGPSPLFRPQPGWVPVFPGIYLAPPGSAGPDATVYVVTPQGTVAGRDLAPPTEVRDEERFLFRVLTRRLAEARDASLEASLARWVEAHGPALGVGAPGS